MHDRWQRADTPQNRVRYLTALADFTPPALVERTLALYLSPDVGIQDGPGAIGQALANRHARRATWDLLEGQWEQVMAKYPPFTLVGLLFPIATTVEDDLGDRMAAFFRDHPLAEVGAQLAQFLELQTVHRSFAHRVAGQLAHELSVPADR